MISLLTRDGARRIAAALAGVTAMGLCASSAAAGGTIDQRNDAFAPNLFNGIQALGPIGQEFVPSLASLSFVELFTQDFDLANRSSETLEVDIHAATITGTVLGTSQPVTLPAGFEGVTPFAFSTPVPLVPGNLYVIEALADPSHDWAVGRTDEGPLDTYPLGRPITLGVPQNPGTADLWFREGIGTVPEPSSLAQLGVGMIALLVMAHFSAMPRPGR
jgi:hypothetical protein